MQQVVRSFTLYLLTGAPSIAAAYVLAVRWVQEVKAQESPEKAWVALLEATHEGLRGGQLFLWNEAARKVEALLGCPAAFDGEPFAQVSSLVSDTAVK